MQRRLETVRSYLEGLQSRLVESLERREPERRFQRDPWERAQGGGGRACVLEEGAVLEKAGVNFSHVRGAELPPSATATRPQLTGRPFHAMGVSVVIHPRNPYAPTAHANVRFFLAPDPDEAAPPVWWFGGGFDLTPHYGFEEDAVHWHRQAKAACDPFGGELYPKFKRACDDYFRIPHRGETRGVGGLFFDDFDQGGFDNAYALARSVGDAFANAYLPILDRRKGAPYGERERAFQSYRRGRYVEFNLVYDRGTLFGLQSGGRVESILMSLPPAARWKYDWTPEPGSPEARLAERFLQPRDWLEGAD